MTTPVRAPLSSPRATLGIGWLGAAFVVQLALSIWLAHLAACAHPDHALGRFSMAGGDHHSYLGAMEHYITEGRYYFLNLNDEEVIAGRMPHYALPYYVLRQFLDVSTASDAMTVLQVLLMSLAIWLLARLLAEETGRTRWGVFFLLMAIGSAHLTPYLYTLLPDAPSFALLAVAVYAYWRTEHRDLPRDRIVLAMALGLLIVLKPYFALLYPLVALRWWMRRTSVIAVTKRCLVLGSPLVFLLAPWWIRNAQHFDRFFPFQQDLYAGYGYGPVELRVRDLLAFVGEDASTWWEPSGMACVLKHEPPLACTYQWPGNFSPQLLERFATLRDTYHRYQRGATPEGADSVMAAVGAVEGLYKDEHPWRSRFINRLILVRKFVVNSGSYHLPVHASNPCFGKGQMMIKLLSSASYVASVLGFVIALPLFLKGRWRRYVPWLVPALYLLVFFPLVLGVVEWRAFAAAYLFDLWLLFLLLGAGVEFMATRFFPRALSRSN